MCLLALPASGESLTEICLKWIVRVYVLNYFDVRFWLHVAIRRRALGWPLAISQEEHLSYGIGSPFYARRLRDIVESNLFSQICFCN